MVMISYINKSVTSSQAVRHRLGKERAGGSSVMHLLRKGFCET